MSPRRNRPSRARREQQPAPLVLDRSVGAVEIWGQERWRVQHLPAPAAVKTYRCPGCDQEIRPRVPHVVVWPADGPLGPTGMVGEADRRHWHTACWRARDRRRPTTR